MSLENALARLGLREFRPGQREAIETLLAARRLLLVAPTGGGKSLVYQLPALELEGTTLVIKSGPTFEVLAKNALDDGFDASPALVDNEIYLRGYKYLYAIAHP